MARALSTVAGCIATLLGYAGGAGCSDGGSDGAGGDPTTSTTDVGGATSSSMEGGAGGIAHDGGASSSGGSSEGGAGGAPPEVFGFPPTWPNGGDCGSEDDIYLWKYADDLYILRQSLCTSFEGNFLFLFFGEDKAMLEDTGNGGIAVGSFVKGLVDDYAAEHGLASLPLVVMHSHSHGDHTAGDGQFQGLPDTTVVGKQVSDVASFFGIDSWPTSLGSIDLGGRVIDVIPTPGHQSAHVALYDAEHELLFTGDMLYPGRLYISDFPAYVDSADRLASFVADGHPVTWVLGTHIEMTSTPGQDFPNGATVHPNERELELTPDHVVELDAAVQAMGNDPVYEVHDDFIVYPL